MGTITDKLNKSIETKEAIRQAIVDRGVDVPADTPFADYPEKINNIKGGPETFYEVVADYNAMTNNGTSYNKLFDSCEDLTEVDLSSISSSKVTDMQYMFNNCKNLTSINLGEFHTDSCSPDNLRFMFSGCNNLQEITVDNYYVINQICKGYTGLSMNAIDGVTKTIYCKEYVGANLTPPTNWVFSYTGKKEPTVNVCSCVSTSESITFSSSSPLIPTIQVATDNGDGTYSIDVKSFSECSFDNMNSIFYDCDSLISLDLRNFNAKNVTNMRNAFYGCSALTSLDLSGFNTSNMTDILRMFDNCYALATLNVSGWDTSKFTSFLDLFYGCSSLTSLDLSDWTTPLVTSTMRMFYNCSSLTTLDIRNFDLAKCSSGSVSNMFYKCDNLREIRLDNCNRSTVKKIIESNSFPTNAIDGATRTIYCQAASAFALTAPTNWTFSIIDL